MIYMINELTHLIEDYCKCDNYLIKEQILIDINLLHEALHLLYHEDTFPL